MTAQTKLAPAMSRVLAADWAFDGVREEAHPDGNTSPSMDRLPLCDEQANPIGAVERYEALAAESTIWLIWSGTYPPTEGPCTDLFDQLREASSTTGSSWATIRPSRTTKSRWSSNVGS